jgi:5-methylcytosine-specific restriction endonuclease McrA
VSVFERLPLSESTTEFLWKRRLRVVDAGEKAVPPTQRQQAQVKEAHKLWEGGYKDTLAFDEIRAILRDMAPGHGFCMYCEYSAGNSIDHFWPINVDPTRAFAWDNYIWSCSVCNSDFKGTKFPWISAVSHFCSTRPRTNDMITWSYYLALAN